MSDRPPYELPSMRDVAAARGSNGLRVISTFSGCGGSCLGFEQAGYGILAASEFIDTARDTYRANHPGVPIDSRDVRVVAPVDLLRIADVDVGEVDVLEGSPPCSAFSMAGRRQEHWGQERAYSGTSQRVDDLFFEFVRLLDGIRPKVFVAENVSGLVRGAAKGMFKEVFRAFGDVGYRVGAQLLDAQWLGVPQVRQRLIFVGVREDLGKDPAFPRPLRYRYALGDVLDLDDEAKEDPETGYPLWLDHSGRSLYEAWQEIREGEQSPRYFSLVRPDRRKPCPTLTAANNRRAVAGVAHPVFPRKFTLAELRRLSSFPADFVLTGSYQQRSERIGRAVPPRMMEAVAATIRDEILS